LYLRPPVDWSIIEQNLERISKAEGNVVAALCITVSVHNILHYPEMLLYLWEKNYKNMNPIPHGQVLDTPSWMSITILPTKAKKVVEERYKTFLNAIAGRLDQKLKSMSVISLRR
jgi:hypothetical protein